MFHINPLVMKKEGKEKGEAISTKTETGNDPFFHASSNWQDKVHNINLKHAFLYNVFAYLISFQAGLHEQDIHHPRGRFYAVLQHTQILRTAGQSTLYRWEG